MLAGPSRVTSSLFDARIYLAATAVGLYGYHVNDAAMIETGDYRGAYRKRPVDCVFNLAAEGGIMLGRFYWR